MTTPSIAARVFRENVADNEALQELIRDVPELAALIDKTAARLDAAEAKRIRKAQTRPKHSRKANGATP